MTVERCSTCRYALMRDGTCPVCGGKQLRDRLPMLAPLPAAPQKEPEIIRYWTPKRRQSA